MRLIIIGLLAILLFSISSSIVNVIGYSNAHHNCVQIESLKTRVRARARLDFKNLPANAILLGLKVTPALIQKAKEAENRTLQDYAPARCSGIFG